MNNYILRIILNNKHSLPMTTPDNSTESPKRNRPETPAISTKTSRELLGSQGALQIDHQGAIYTLRATSKGGLILTK